MEVCDLEIQDFGFSLVYQFRWFQTAFLNQDLR